MVLLCGVVFMCVHVCISCRRVCEHCILVHTAQDRIEIKDRESKEEIQRKREERDERRRVERRERRVDKEHARDCNARRRLGFGILADEVVTVTGSKHEKFHHRLATGTYEPRPASCKRQAHLRRLSTSRMRKRQFAGQVRREDKKQWVSGNSVFAVGHWYTHF